MILFNHGANADNINGHRERASQLPVRERTNINANWRFQRFTTNPDNLSYAKLKPWILPSANDFVKDASRRVQRPKDPPENVTYAQATFDDSSWESLNLPHDWAVKGPFYTGSNAPVGGGMGRLPSQGIGWYRKRLSLTSADEGRTVYLDLDGAMSYAAVWLNGNLVGGWPYGYASFRLDLTPYLRLGDNQLAIRLDQPLESSRWYPGAGIYRDVWLTKVHPVHVGQSGTYVTSKSVSAQTATLDLAVQVKSAAKSGEATEVQVVTDIYILDAGTGSRGSKIGQFPSANISVKAGTVVTTNATVILQNPKLWGPPPAQEPNLHVAVTNIYVGGEVVDTYETEFGIRSVSYAGDGLRVNGQRIYLQGVCQHHDLGSLGSAFNIVAARRQLSMLQDMGSNAIRTSHNPPAPQLLQLADRMGILVLDEIFDTWGSHKVKNDFQTIFADWSEPDLRAFIRRDRNHPSVWAWSFGNEIAEQRSSNGATAAQRLRDIIREEDSTRRTTVGMNNAGPDTAFTSIVDLIGLNYQGEGMGTGAPTFQNFRSKFPDKMIFSTESSSVVSSRGTYLFPVASGNSVTVNTNGQGADSRTRQVSSYELYAVSWGASPDKVFAGQDQYPYVGGEFVWTGWDYLGEPTPFDSSRSSYFGIIDLAGFPKDRFYLYQARWNPNVKMAHILPHWNWPDRVGQVTPVHVFSSGDEAELFVNGVSQGRQKKATSTYRFRWDKVTYQSGEVKVVTYKNGKEWATATRRTTGAAAKLNITTYGNRTSIRANGEDLSFLTVAVVDEKGDVVPEANPTITFSVKGAGEIVSTDNGDPTDMTVFPSKERKAFRGLSLAIVRAKAGGSGAIVVGAQASGLESTEFTLQIE
ncbi:glycoside hydrolase family 2 protein [Aaosphaeria arxii CBS 175.79]|uniref:Glycoside hydrolase family 2 protein n=1 Tax=Aaosphaeria arxii CBS 175.79 TaxID=1450172 RepID=A0A6A5Y7V8_9PLEO|nr:glycoside hydrolase family 2 protein [Aaosphaeria arxii CBS 175.79]KAF2021665.1 glycoside hydrolase family 2 protein [Aaosphaeria arxii CBS 175.79]